MFPKTEAQARLLATAERLAAGFAERAAEHDREGSFPFRNFEEMREAGYLAAAVPAEYGGDGHELTAVTLAQLAIARGDGSTALSVGMHHMVLGGEAAAHAWPDALRERIFRDAVEHGALINNLATEPDLGSPRGGGRPATTITPDGDGRWRINGRKTFSTLAPVLSYLITYGAFDDGSGDVGRFAVPRDRPGIRIDETWDAIGMRATGSHDVYFKDVPVEESDLLSRRSLTGRGEGGAGDAAAVAKPRIEDARTGQGGAWFPLLVGAANLGVAEAARDYAIRFARERQPTGAPAPIAQIPSVRERIGRMESTLMNARTVLLATTEDWDEHPAERASMGPAVANAKIYAVNGAIEVVEHAMRVVGGVALLRSEPLERYLRDVRSGLANPPIEARGLEAIAASVLDGSNEG